MTRVTFDAQLVHVFALMAAPNTSAPDRCSAGVPAQLESRAPQRPGAVTAGAFVVDTSTDLQKQALAPMLAHIHERAESGLCDCKDRRSLAFLGHS